MKIHILAIKHARGVNLYPCATKEAADRELKGYIAEWYKDEMGKTLPNPITDDDVADYFEKAWFESYVITEGDLVEENLMSESDLAETQIATEEVIATMIFDAGIPEDIANQLGHDILQRIVHEMTAPEFDALAMGIAPLDTVNC
jgi:hypothetical protein